MNKIKLPIGMMVSDVVSSFFKRPVTRRYPFERKEAPQAFRGQLTWNPATCTGCMLCVKDCPANAIELTVVDRASKRFVMRFNTGRCTYCAQCEVNCRSKSLVLSNDQWELAALTKEPFTVYYGAEADIQTVLAATAKPPELGE